MSNVDIKTIIKNHRIEAGLTMKELADLVGVSEATVSRWESGNIASMKHSQIASLCNALHISPALIVPGIEYSEHDETISSPASKKEITLSEHDINLIKAYNAAPDNARQVVNLTLEPFMPVDINTKVNQLSELLDTVGISCSYTNENGDGNNDNFVLLVMKFYDRDGKRIPINTPVSHVDSLEDTYQRLLPAIRASGETREELLRQYVRERFDMEIAILEDRTYISNNTLINVSKSVVEKRQERNRRDGVIYNGRIGDESEDEIDAVK